MREFNSGMWHEEVFLCRQVTGNAESFQGREYESDEHIVDTFLTFIRIKMSIKLRKPVR